MANTIDVLGDDVVMDSLIERTITEMVDDKITRLGSYAFSDCTALVNADFPAATVVGDGVFTRCTSLVSVNLPKVTSMMSNVFSGCTKLTNINLPLMTSLGSSTFYNCDSLQSIAFPEVTWIASAALSYCNNLYMVDFPKLTSIGSFVFSGDTSLFALLLRNTEKMCELSVNHYAFDGTPIASGTGYIYVPRALVNNYKADSQWSAYANQIRAIEDYTVDGTVTGEFASSFIGIGTLGNMRIV